jgi:prevent-host-death family protein
METIGAFEAKTHLASFLERVSKGEKFTITRRGVPAAMLVPIGAAQPKLTHQEIVEGMRALRKRVKPGKMSVREMVADSRSGTVRRSPRSMGDYRKQRTRRG